MIGWKIISMMNVLKTWMVTLNVRCALIENERKVALKKGELVFYCFFDSLDYALVYSFFIWKNAAVASMKPIQISSNPMTGMTAPISTNNPAVPNKPTPDFADN
jgi:hypothetical protein